MKEIWRLAIPAIVTNITSPLLGLCDLAIVGQLGSAAFIAAIAVGTSMMNMLYWLLGFLRMGTSGLTAQAYGAQAWTRARLTLWRALAVGVGIGALFICLREPLCSWILAFMDPDEPTREMAEAYFLICIWGAPAFLGSFVLTGWYLGMQNSKITMWISILTNVTNIGLSLVLVLGWHLGMTGVACGTLIAQWVAFLTGMAYIHRELSRHAPKAVDSLENIESIEKLDKSPSPLAIYIDIFLRTVMLVAVTVWFTRVGAQQGPVMLAVNALLMQLFTLFSFFMDGFAFAGEALCGRFQGAGDQQQLKLTIRHLHYIGAGVALLFTLIYACGGTSFLSLMSDERGVVEAAGEYLWWAASIPFMGFLAFTWDGIFIGLTATRKMLMAMGSATAIYFIVYLLLYPTLANHGLWIAFLAYLLTRGLVSAALFNSANKQKTDIPH